MEVIVMIVNVFVFVLSSSEKSKTERPFAQKTVFEVEIFQANKEQIST